jgi:hypothetical protein
MFAWRWSQRGPGRASVAKAIDRFRTSSTAVSASKPLQPLPGVYLYNGSGSEALSFLGTQQSQGPTEPGTVTILPDGCWSFQLDFNSFHSQTWIRCATNGRLVERGGTADQKFDFVAFKESEHSPTTCTPPFVLADPAARPGTTWPLRCTVRSQTTKTTAQQTGTLKYIGRENVTIGGVAVPALHVHQSVRLSGGQTGSVSIDLWLADTTGLPLREQHLIKVVSPAPAPINEVTYTERGNWQLSSLTPRH